MRPTHIIIHHSLTKDGETVNWQAIRRYHTSYRKDGKILTEEHARSLIKDGVSVELPWSDIGYHAGIELVNEDYEVLQGRMFNVPGGHCKQQNMNYKSIGICLVGNFDLISPPPAQLSLLINYVRSLMDLLYIPPTCVHPHSEFASYKSCPGTKFPWADFYAAIGG